ncbi:MAG: hypothetical protein HDR14_08680 [Lachnospiraceae bacterium]|nr:hypothetical protein [Lachnospiraceae bacterium]
MAYFSVKLASLVEAEQNIGNISKQLSGQIDSLETIDNLWLVYKNRSALSGVHANLRKIRGEIALQKQETDEMKAAISNIAAIYQKTEREVLGLASEEKKSKWDTFVEEFRFNYGWSDLLKGSNYIGTIYGFYQDIKNGQSINDFLHTGKDIYDFVSGAAKTYNNYKKIGNAVGRKTSTVWWLKHITGLNKLNRVSTAKNPINRFLNNLTNKTSPYNAQIKKTIGDYAGKNGAKAACAKWGNVLFSGVANYFANKEEQANSDGEMSDTRVWAETITETVVGTALQEGAKIVVGAAVSALLPAAPVVAVVALTGLTTTLIGAGVKALTGQSVTEWVSDIIVDAGEVVVKKAGEVVGAVGKAAGKAAKEVGKAVNNVGKAVGKWFGKLF